MTQGQRHSRSRGSFSFRGRDRHRRRRRTRKAARRRMGPAQVSPNVDFSGCVQGGVPARVFTARPRCQSRRVPGALARVPHRSGREDRPPAAGAPRASGSVRTPRSRPDPLLRFHVARQGPTRSSTPRGRVQLGQEFRPSGSAGGSVGGGRVGHLSRTRQRRRPRTGVLSGVVPATPRAG